MRYLAITVCGFFLTSTLLGCGGATIPSPPENAKAGPPPGTSPEMTKFAKDAKRK